MDDSWIEIPDPTVDAAELVERIRGRMAARGHVSAARDAEEDPRILADRLWKQMINSDTDYDLPIRERDCDIVPRSYVIDWRVPILGPIHARVRRIINAEVRRYLLSSLEKQSYLNREMLRLLDDLVKENERLHRELEELRESRG